MHKELIRSMKIGTAYLREMRIQAENISRSAFYLCG
jgi:hypothetical protein